MDIPTIDVLTPAVDDNAYPHGIYCCLIPDGFLKFAKFQSVKKERQVHAIHYVSLPSRTAPTGLLQTVRIRKYITFPANHKILLGNALPLTHFNTVYMWTFYPFIVYAQSVCAFYYDSQPHVSMQLRRYM